jgi:hypothetical protein
VAVVPAVPLLADCAVTGATGSGGQVVVCTASDTDGYDGTANGDEITIQPGATVTDPADDDAIIGNAGEDVITMNGGTVTAAMNDALAGGDGNDVITVHAGNLDGEEDAVDGDPGDDVLTVNGGVLVADEQCVDGGDGDDTININGGTLTCDDEVLKGEAGAENITITGGSLTSTGEDVIDTDEGDDVVSIRNATLTTQDEPGHVAINLDSGDDQLTLGDGAVIQGNVEGLIEGGDDTDTLIFAMTVPEGDLAAVQAAIAAANPAGDSLTINGETYTWQNFESLVDQVEAQSPGAPEIPALGVPGLVLLALLLVGAGALLMRSRPS